MSSHSPEHLCHLDATDLSAGYRQRDFSPVDVLEAVLARTERLNPRYNMFYHLVADAARVDAQASAQRWAQGRPLSALDGVPVSIKDSVAMKGTPMQGALAPCAPLSRRTTRRRRRACALPAPCCSPRPRCPITGCSARA